MNILLHQCCGPCSVYPVKMLKSQGHSITGYWFNPNIHPVTEFYKRLETLRDFDKAEEIPMIIDETYGLVNFVRNVADDHKNRCGYCYTVRLEAAAKMAAEKGFDAFSSTLFYSKYQNHDLMKQIAESMAEKYSVCFYYEDYREGWKYGIDTSKALGMYRQPYCGCIYSEEDRYLTQLSKRFNSQA